MKQALRRLLASVMLVTVVASLAAPPHAMAGACRENGAGGPPTLVAAMDHGACEHPGAGPCLLAVGCVNAPPALRPASATVASTLTAVLNRPVAVPQYADLFRAGPPTPPPNSI